MSRPRKPRRPTRGSNPNYEVGYGRAPISGRWKPGRSGNPSGKRKRKKTVGDVIDETFLRKVTIQEDGRRITLTLQELIIRNLGSAAAGGDMGAIRTLFALKERYRDSEETTLNPSEFDPDDQAIIEAHFEKIQSEAAASTESTGEGAKRPAAVSNPEHTQTIKGE
jgi:hypothetical protein